MLSRGPLTLERLQHLQFSQHVGSKPDGIWYSCDNAWAEWFQAEIGDVRPEYTHAYALRVDESQLWCVRNVRHFDALQRRFGVVSHAHSDEVSISWPVLAGIAGGVEICPYLWDRREVDWYYPWDVASGCIWRGDIILGLEEVELR